jgi:hypothetical protein
LRCAGRAGGVRISETESRDPNLGLLDRVVARLRERKITLEGLLLWQGPCLEPLLPRNDPPHVFEKNEEMHRVVTAARAFNSLRTVPRLTFPVVRTTTALGTEFFFHRSSNKAAQFWMTVFGDRIRTRGGCRPSSLAGDCPGGSILQPGIPGCHPRRAFRLR